MKLFLSIAALAASLVSGSFALPTNNSTSAAGQHDTSEIRLFGSPKYDYSTSFIDLIASKKNQATDKRGLSRRDPLLMVNGATYADGTWVVTVQGVTQAVVSSTWHFYSVNGPAFEWDAISRSFADSVTGILGDGTTRQNIWGGWSWYGTTANGWDFNSIPWQMCYNMAYSIIELAGDLYAESEQTNYVGWQFYSTSGELIYQFAIYPADWTG